MRGGLARLKSIDYVAFGVEMGSRERGVHSELTVYLLYIFAG